VNTAQKIKRRVPAGVAHNAHYHTLYNHCFVMAAEDAGSCNRSNNGDAKKSCNDGGGGTWPVFLFHFALPMALLFIVSNFDDIYSNLVSLPYHSTVHRDREFTDSATKSSRESVPSDSQDLESQMPQLTQKQKERFYSQQQTQSTKTTTSAKQSSTSSTSTPSRRHQNTAKDPLYIQMESNILALRNKYKQAANTPTEHLAAIQLADFLKYRDTVIHDGGTYQMEAIDVYSRALFLLEEKWRDMIANGEDTRKPMNAQSLNLEQEEMNNYYYSGLNREIFLDYGAKSIEGTLCAVYCNLGKTFFMSNLFERAVQSYDQCLSYDHDYFDALNSRGQSYIILGKYKEAATDFHRVLQMDSSLIFVDAVTGLARCLSADDTVIDGGWNFLINLLELNIPHQEESLQKTLALNDNDAAGTIKHYANILKRMHHAMFQYHDIKTKNASEAWKHLSKGNEYKMTTVAPFDEAFEIEKVSKVKQVFTKDFFPSDIGSESETPIFIIGFVRSGSTLLERILDSHPLIVGTGEDSVFNGRLDAIRRDIIQSSMAGQDALRDTVKKLADDVVSDMRTRWEIIDANTHSEEDSQEDGDEEKEVVPTRFVDKMLTNYMNVGFIHILFPKALILHVAREPMDSIFSAFKHDFPPGGLDYTSEFVGLARLYHGYRDVMEHWEKVLPGRVTHIRYEDMVTDLPGIAPKIIEKVGVPWDPTVLDYHKKKHAVNTLSTTQVRKGVYSHHFKGWKRYEEFLAPLLERVGNRVEFNLTTSL
jgi:tetratricopeptide (TPR) repeat protein